MNFGPPELVLLLVVLLVLFGGSKVPQLARNLGKAQSEFKSGLAEAQGLVSEATSMPAGGDLATPPVGPTPTPAPTASDPAPTWGPPQV